VEFVAIFDFIRHLFEFLFYLITGPLVGLFAYRKVVQSRNADMQIFELQKDLFELATRDQRAFREKILPLVAGLDATGKSDLSLSEGSTSSE
jgi:hypothetical protein